MLTLVPSMPTPTSRRQRIRTPEAVSEDVLSFIEVAKKKEPHLVAQALRRKLNESLDEELEVLATHVLSEAIFDIHVPEVLGPLGRGDRDGALHAAVSRMRRKFAKMLRDHQRSESDNFYDECIVE